VLPCTTVRTGVLLFLLALGVRLVLVAGFADPAYPDSFYYVDVARNLASGHGFSVDFVWIFAEVGGTLPANPVLPIASNGHWMPLASLVQVPFIWLLGPTTVASALPFALFGALAAPIARGIALEAGASPRVALGAGILGAVPALATPFLAQPDNFGLYEPLVAAALWMTARGLKGHARSYVLAGLLVGVATLARNDGVLVGAAVGLAFLWDRWLWWRSGGARVPAIPVWAAIACAGLFILVVAPWVARQLAVFSTISPSTASGKVLFIRNIGEWNSITTPATLQHLLGEGIGPLLASRIDGLVAAITIFSVLVGGVVLAPFMVVGAWRRRRSRDFGPLLTYAAILFAFSAIISAVHVPGGTFIHSAIALAPGAYVLALEGIVGCVAWIVARRRNWDRAAAERIFTTAAVGFALVAAVAGSITTQAVWSGRRDDFRALGAALDAAGAPATDRVMSIDASGTRYWTGRGGVVLVNDPLDTVGQVARAYDIRWLVINRADSVPAAALLLAGERPSWVGAPILATAGEAGGRAELRLAVFPVCTQAGDPRCAGGTP
jgi:4-amino-4-deoxy-L-arabinose transferase-like glycosyltransferase